MNLRAAQSLALRIQAELAPLCERIEIAGSIRRARPVVNDVDLVILPRPGRLAEIKARCERRCAVVTSGEQNYIVRLPGGMQLDIFFARPPRKDLLQTEPGNFGTLLLCRTGSREHNIWLVGHAKARGMTWAPYRGVLDGDGYVVAAETEAEIFEALGLEFIAPEQRER